MKNCVAIFTLWVMISCHNDKAPFQYSFAIPKVQYKDTIRTDKVLFVKDNLDWVCAFFCGKYRVGQPVIFDGHKVFYKDSIFFKNSISLDYIDSFNDALKFETDSFKVITDYTQDLLLNWFATDPYNCYYPVFIQNESSKTKILLGKDDSVFSIQEAKDEKGIWRPIETRGKDFCGNGRWGLKIYPREFAVFLLPKYKGDFVTDIRARVKVGKNIYVSDSFIGNINRKQFWLKKFKKEDKLDAQYQIDQYFFGSIPLQLDSSYSTSKTK